MKIGVATSNDAFLKPLENELNRRGHDILKYRHTGDPRQDAFQLGQLRALSERAFVDWAQDPLLEVLGGPKDPWAETHLVFCRVHRIEMYLDDYIQQIPWPKVAGLFFIADHVRERFLAKVPAPPRNVIALPHVGIREDMWWIDEAARSWEPPYVIVMAGNIVPKKRVYTAVQMLADLPEEFHLHIYGQGGQAGYGNPEYHINIGDLIDDLGLGNRVQGRPPVPHEELCGIFQRAHFVLSASNEEGCHTSVAEGMACGCVPLVGGWRGAGNVYPEEWVWKTPRGLYGLCDRWAGMPEDEQRGLTQWARDWVLPKYDARIIAGQMADVITGPLDAQTVGLWYDTEMFDQMAEQDGNGRQADALVKAQALLAGRDAPRVLELGCGTGYLTRSLAAGGVAAFGQDISTRLVEWAREQGQEGATFEFADMTQRLIKGPWDLVTLVDVLEHIQTHLHQPAIVRVADQLKPGGVALIRFPHRVHDKQLIEEYVFPKVLRQMCRKAGLEVTEFRELEAGYFEIVAVKP